MTNNSNMTTQGREGGGNTATPAHAQQDAGANTGAVEIESVRSVIQDALDRTSTALQVVRAAVAELEQHLDYAVLNDHSNTSQERRDMEVIQQHHDQLDLSWCNTLEHAQAHLRETLARDYASHWGSVEGVVEASAEGIYQGADGRVARHASHAELEGREVYASTLTQIREQADRLHRAGNVQAATRELANAEERAEAAEAEAQQGGQS